MPSGGSPLIVGFGGTGRSESTSERALRLALSVVEQQGAAVEAFFGPDLAFPMYQPHQIPEDPRALQFVSALQRADGIIIASPGYHGTISGLIKNAIDHIELLRDDPRPYFEGRAVGCIACAAGWQASASTLASLRSVVHALRGWPTPLGAMLNSSISSFAADGNCSDAKLAAQLSCIARQVLFFGEYAAECRTRIVDNSVDKHHFRKASPASPDFCGSPSTVGEGITQ
jgi:FMN reductase